MKNVKRKKRNRGWEDYKTTLILLSILLAIMSLVILMPLKKGKQSETSTSAVFAK
ncbi:MAG: hypothetical protein JWQ84_3570 [Mucilaginibacter sp.]|nr:hypothetical protein [Mucilaginibacter sp.]MDB5018738.1 hypothetical protein [Mucilaginibacter sp.]MDB5140145.1 hypothetical protein [Mucilaginibacter sp.]